MLRLNASFSKKVPIEGQDYSSQSYHASVEVEIPDGLNPEQLRERIHDTFALVRESVEIEFGHEVPALPAQVPQERHTAPAPAAEAPASPRQVKYLTELALRQGLDLRDLADACQREFGVTSVEALSRRQASELIDRMSGRNGNARQAPRRAA
jgi:hypothetical protein